MFFFFNHNTKPLDRSQIKDGEVVAFEYEYGRGVALMEDGDYFYSAYNLLKRDQIWVDDIMPQDIQLLPPTKEDMLLAIDQLFIPKYDENSMAANFWPDSLLGVDASVRQAIDNVNKALDDQNEIQEHIVKRWKERLDEEIQNSLQIKAEWKKETEEHCNYIDKLEKEAKAKDERIKVLEAKIKQMKNEPSEDAFVRKFVKETMHFYKHDRKKADAIRQIMIKVGRSDADADIDAWMEGRETPLITIEKAGDVISEGGKKIVKIVKDDKEE